MKANQRQTISNIHEALQGIVENYDLVEDAADNLSDDDLLDEVRMLVRKLERVTEAACLLRDELGRESKGDRHEQD